MILLSHESGFGALVGGLVGRAINNYLCVNSAYMPVAASAKKKQTNVTAHISINNKGWKMQIKKFVMGL